MKPLCWFCVAIVAVLLVCSSRAQEAPATDAALATWKALSRDERAELLRRFDDFRSSSAEQRELLRSRAKILGRHSLRLMEDLRSFDPERLAALRALPPSERRAEMRRLLEQRIESDVLALRESFSDSQWQEIRAERAPHRGASVARHLRDRANAEERRSLARWAREGAIEPAFAEELSSLPWEDRAAGVQRAWRQRAATRIAHQRERRPELFPEVWWNQFAELDDHAVLFALRECRERVQREATGIPAGIPRFLLPGPAEMRRLASLPFAERRDEMRRTLRTRFEDWAQRHGAEESQLGRWRELDLEQALREAQRWRANARSGDRSPIRDLK